MRRRRQGKGERGGKCRCWWGVEKRRGGGRGGGEGRELIKENCHPVSFVFNNLVFLFEKVLSFFDIVQILPRFV